MCSPRRANTLRVFVCALFAVNNRTDLFSIWNSLGAENLAEPISGLWPKYSPDNPSALYPSKSSIMTICIQTHTHPFQGGFCLDNKNRRLAMILNYLWETQHKTGCALLLCAVVIVVVVVCHLKDPPHCSALELAYTNSSTRTGRLWFERISRCALKATVV